ncbi:MAG TPA: MIP/aquaporin family protein [Verrucomicrobiae bacterium]|nr:MIP/aquaporin family protein [Verrucomicrobiae bacterium]
MSASLSRRAVAEFIGTAFLVAAVVGSGIMGQRLAGGNVAIALLANTIATGAALVALITALGPVSGAHLNPVVTLLQSLERRFGGGEALAYVVAQIAGGVGGSILAHLMFGLPLLSLSIHARSGPAQVFSEFVATFGLVAVIWSSSRFQPSFVAVTVGAYITAAYWFTASTSFANPAVTIARCLSNTFSGIRPADAPWFMLAQFSGGLAAVLLFRWLVARQSARPI